MIQLPALIPVKLSGRAGKCDAPKWDSRQTDLRAGARRCPFDYIAVRARLRGRSHL